MSYIVSDNSGGGKALCEYALEHGHKKIGFFCRGRVNETISIRDRYMGYAAALEEKGLGVNLDYVYANIDDKYEILVFCAKTIGWQFKYIIVVRHLIYRFQMKCA